MKIENFKIWKDSEYHYPMSFGFVPNLMNYMHEDSEIRDYVMVVPGGGYAVVSPTEGEIVAKEFFQRGYNVGVLTYTTNLLQSTPLKDQPLKDISRAVRYVRASNKESKVIICGFSAGGHLCGSLSVHFEDILEDNIEYQQISNRPDACILSYPVITSGELGHKDSMKNLLGAEVYDTDNLQKELDYFSLEKQIKKNTPPCFLWHTVTDEEVPVENTFLFQAGLRKFKIPCAMHIYSQGGHGLSLSNDVWANGKYGEPYTLQQTFNIIEAIKKDILPLEANVKEMLLKQFEMFEGNGEQEKREPIKEVEGWVNLVHGFLNNYISGNMDTSLEGKIGQ